MRRILSLGLMAASLVGGSFWIGARTAAAADADKPAADQDKPANDAAKPADEKPADDKKPADAGKEADANAGQADLDKATEKKLSAETLDDLADVLKYCESALKAGLSPANAQFANDLYTSTLLQRGTFYTQAVFDRKTGEPAPQWRKMRLDALADLEKVVGRDPKSGPAQLMVAKLENLPEGDRTKAFKAADQAVTLIKDEPALQTAAYVIRGQLQTDPDKQLADFNEAIKLTSADQEALRSRAIFFVGHKKYEEALKDLEQLLRVDPKNELVVQLKGETLFMLKRNAEAMRTFDQAVQLRPGSAFPYVNRARIRAEQNDTKGALEDLDTALKMQNDDPAALFTRARVYKQMNEPTKAQADIDTALKNGAGPLLFRQLLAARGLRAMIAAESGDYDQVIVDLEELIKIAPQNADLRRQIGVLYTMSKHYDKAIEQFEELAKLMPKNPETLFQLGILYTLNKQTDKAIEKYSQVIEQDDKSFQAYRSRGDAYLNIGKHAEAIKDYEAAFKIKPDDSGLLNNFAWVLATSPDDKLRDGKRSVELATKACELTDFEAAHILSTLAGAYAETGDFDAAVKWSSKAVEASGNDVETGEPDVKVQLKKELESYKEKKPTRELLNEDAKKDKK